MFGQLRKFVKACLPLGLVEFYRSRRMRRMDTRFIDLLKLAIPGWISDGNILGFEYAIAHLPSDNPVLEIGTFCGLSTNIINHFLRKYRKKNKIFTCDKWILDYLNSVNSGLYGTEINGEEFGEYIKNIYIHGISIFSKNNLPYTIESFSDDFFELWDRNATVHDVLDRSVKLGVGYGVEGISFAYIDGLHTYDQAKSDFENVDKYLDNGGFILFDDSVDTKGSGIGLLGGLMREITMIGKYELVMKNPNYLFKKVK